MKTLYAALTIFALSMYLALPGCSHVAPGTVVGDCGREVAADLLPTIESALVSQNYLGELGALVSKFGTCVVRNGVEHIVANARMDAQFGAVDRNAQTKIIHGEDFLKKTPPK